MKLIGPFSEIRTLKDVSFEIKSQNEVQFPLKNGGIIVNDSNIIEVGDFAILYSKYKEQVTIEEIEDYQVLMLSGINNSVELAIDSQFLTLKKY